MCVKIFLVDYLKLNTVHLTYMQAFCKLFETANKRLQNINSIQKIQQ